MRFVVLAAVLASPAVAFAGEPPLRTAVTVTADVHRRPKTGTQIQEDVVKLLPSLGAEAVPTSEANLSTCSTAECLRGLQERASVTHLLSIKATYDQAHSFSATVSLFDTSDGKTVGEGVATCNYTCTVADLRKEIERLTTKAFTEAKAAKTRAPVVAVVEPVIAKPVAAPLPAPSPLPSADIDVAKQNPSVEKPRGYGFGWWAIGGGAAAAAAGLWLVTQNGKLTNCRTPGDDSTCATERKTMLPGVALIGVGGLAAAAGVADLFSVFGSRRRSGDLSLLLGPSSVALKGRF